MSTNQNSYEVTGDLVNFQNEEYYKISNVQKMPAFFIGLASNCDIWMFLSSNGSLTAGRKNVDGAIFPYETDDKIHLNTSTGPKTIVKLLDNDSTYFWEPFDKSVVKPYSIRRNLYKNIWGSAIIYEEINDTLNISFCYKWECSEKFGLIRTSFITNNSNLERNIHIIDGVQNIMPYGIPSALSEGKSCLTDAYKASELCEATNIAIYSLTSKINDVPEPVEILNANIAWSICDNEPTIMLSPSQIESFCEGLEVKKEIRSLGKKGAYFTYQELSLQENSTSSWMIILEVALNHCQIASLQNLIKNTDKKALLLDIQSDILESTKQLRTITAFSDGLQRTNDEISSKHHFVNVLYNNMRGGVFDDGYDFDFDELISFINIRNKSLYHSNKDFFDKIKENPNVLYLKKSAHETNNADLIHLCLEFLPICFSRRHGDPSRPWNKFFINLKNDSGKRLYHYEGNWRDIFQNWESMCLSFPEYLDNIIAKFLNASTADGFNPYRISKEGIDWEIPDPHDPFSGLGYWGDHQIIYLLRLLEALNSHNPKALEHLFEKDIFCYANVPYKIKPYADIIINSKSTVVFDSKKHYEIMDFVKTFGTDGKLIFNNSNLYYVSFMEKLIVPVLSKLSNLIIGGGIWMNTERPEWNDANNALVGNGLSMVTVYQLRRHLVFLKNLLESFKDKDVLISHEVKVFFGEVFRIFNENISNLNKDGMTNNLIREILNNLSNAFSSYREVIYSSGFSTKENITYNEFNKFFELSLAYIDFTIDLNKDENGFYHAYNILKLTDDTLEISHLMPMLEGQTAVLGSGKLSASEALSLIKTMEDSPMYSKEQSSFYLYPVKSLKTFMDKNILPSKYADISNLIKLLIEDGDITFISKDMHGNIRLNESIVDIHSFLKSLENIKQNPKYSQLVTEEFDSLCDIYDEIFKHKEFTGRSGRMYKYEGIGCIYWHQNAKFLLSLEETFFDSLKTSSKDELSALKDTYYRLRKGLGFNKDPKTWGAFPLDPYSHTPYLQGAQQPGMTGQVKEEILTRRLELGVMVTNGSISFNPALLRKTEFFTEGTLFNYFDLNGNNLELNLEEGSLAFTLCQIPVIYKLSKESRIEFEMDNNVSAFDGLTLSSELSQKVFSRDNAVNKIVVYICEEEII